MKIISIKGTVFIKYDEFMTNNFDHKYGHSALFGRILGDATVEGMGLVVSELMTDLHHGRGIVVARAMGGCCCHRIIDSSSPSFPK